MLTIYTDQHQRHATDAVRTEGDLLITEEVPARAEIIVAAVRAAGLGPVQPPEDFGRAPLLAVHAPDYVDFLASLYAKNAAYYQGGGPVFGSTFAPRGALHRPAGYLGQVGYYAFDVGSPVLEGTWDAAYASAQCALTAAARVRAGEPVAYALCRPPGHHAAQAMFGGYCYLNNAAIAARWLQAQGSRVAVLDVDYHHGNGTQAIFYADPHVLTCSLHADPDEDYPFYWGAAGELGEGAGLGFNCNFPLPLGTDDARYLAVLTEALAIIRAYGPACLVVSVGFDTAVGDPVGGFTLTPGGLAAVGEAIAGLGLPTVLVQEGGYRLDTLAENSTAFLRACADRASIAP
ncbi:MAG: histone deacetylase family protein [Anaerolineales bacterium]|nr:histone deacetylase family protein [Anaerolineales bacterium]